MRRGTKLVLRTIVLLWLCSAMVFGSLSAQAADKLDRTVLPIPEPKLAPITELDARNAKAPPRFEVKAPAKAPERAHRADRRHGLRPVERLRRADPHADAREAGEERAALQPLPHHGALLADPRGAADRPQPPRLQHGLDHGDRHRVPRPDRAAARTASRRWPRCCGSTATARPPSASSTRRPPGKSARPARPTAGRPARASTSSTASSAARRTSGRRRIYEDMSRVEAAEGPELPLHDRHDQPGDQLDAAPRSR